MTQRLSEGSSRAFYCAAYSFTLHFPRQQVWLAGYGRCPVHPTRSGLDQLGELVLGAYYWDDPGHALMAPKPGMPADVNSRKF
jgi:hypothetical protein